MSQGIQVIHLSGSEIFRNPVEAVWSVVEAVTEREMKVSENGN